MSHIVVGIDLGTTNSLIGMVRQGDVCLFPDDRGDVLLPSAVGPGDGGTMVVGRAARNQRALDPGRVVLSVKRAMGRKSELRVGDRHLSPAQISALILGALLDRAAKAVGERPERAIITVPAYFDDAQRQATWDAGEIAGLTVERLVNEPTAAALGYQSGAEELVLVYDLGGGTFDVSILERDDALLEVTTSHGDTQLGGDDVDEALCRWVLDRLGRAGETIAADPRARTRLLEAVERAKIALSDRDEVHLFDPFIAGENADAVHLDLPITRSDLATVAKPLVQRTLHCIDRALRDAKIAASELDRVLLVGGASKMPLVVELVSNHLDMPAQLDADAERAVAKGAALLAGRAMGESVRDVLVDITPHTLAAGVIGHLHDDDDHLTASAVIPRGTVIPVERQRTYYTAVPDQDAVGVPIGQGEHRRMDAITELGEVRIEGLPPSPEGSPVEVTFRLDLSGVLHVSATHVPSGRSAQVRIAKSPYRLTQRARNEARAEVAALGAREQPRAEATEAERTLAKAMLTRATRALERTEGAPAALTRVRTATEELRSALERSDPELSQRTDELSDALLDLL